MIQKFSFLIFFSPVFCIYTSFCSTWVNQEKIVPTVYYQGMGSSQIQCLKYTPELQCTTGEIISSIKGINVIYFPFIGCEIDEVIPKKLKNKWYKKLNPLTIIEEFALKKMNKNYGCALKKTSALNNNETLLSHSLYLSKFNFGQDLDISNHEKKWHACCQQYPSNPKILYGVSRGAATTFNALAQNNYDAALVILEACFDSVENTLYESCSKVLRYLGFHKTAHYLVEKLCSYKRNGVSPLKNVAKFPKNIPVVFITSQKDKLVPRECTKNLAQAVANTRTESDASVYLLTLSHSSHPCYPTQHEEDKQLYQSFLHQIYKEYSLPYIKEFTQPNFDIELYRIKRTEG